MKAFINKHRLALTHLAVFAALSVYIFVYGKCVFREITGIPCPFCGLTRASLSAFQFKISEAFYYHPLFLFIPPYLFFCFHYRKFKIKEKPANIAIIAGALIILAVYILRMCLHTVP